MAVYLGKSGYAMYILHVPIVVVPPLEPRFLPAPLHRHRNCRVRAGVRRVRRLANRYLRNRLRRTRPYRRNRLICFSGFAPGMPAPYVRNLRPLSTVRWKPNRHINGM